MYDEYAYARSLHDKQKNARHARRKRGRETRVTNDRKTIIAPELRKSDGQ